MNVRAFLGAAFGVACIAAAAVAQAKTPEPRRPGVDGDRNDPKAYYALGVKMLDHSPTEAADAFYWAIRLDPGWADAYYGRWTAIQLTNPGRYMLYKYANRDTYRAPDVLAMDSLMARALWLNPFLYQKFQQLLIERGSERWAKDQGAAIDEAGAASSFQTMFNHGSHYVRAIGAYVSGDFPRALKEWTLLLPAVRFKMPVHAARGRLFFMLGSYDSAAVQLTLARDELEQFEKDSLLPFYISKAAFEQELGVVAVQKGDRDGAREAYGRALTEDLSYAPAHVALSTMDLAKGDTAGALSEMDIAAQVAPFDGYLAYEYGRALLMADHQAEALEQLVRAVKLEPYYAEPHVLIGAIYDHANYSAEALAAYSDYVRLANHNDDRVQLVESRIASLKTLSAHAQIPSKP